MNTQYVVYIDDAGDDGLGKLRSAVTGGQSCWFVIGACCVRSSNDRKMVEWRDEILKQTKSNAVRDLHFKRLKHDQRRLASKILGSKPVRLACVLSNKQTLLELPADRLQSFKQKNHLHNYLCRWLLERVSRALKSDAIHNGYTNCSAKVVFSRRGGMNYTEFCDYLMLIKNGEEVRYSPGMIDWDVIDPTRIDARDHGSRAGLQLADVGTSAVFHSVEPNRFGILEQTYLEELRKVILRPRMSDGTLKPAYNCGITHVPRLTAKTPLTLEQRLIFESFK